MARIYIKSFMCPHCETKCAFFGKGVNHQFVLFCNSCGQGVYFCMPDNYCFDETYPEVIPIDTKDIVEYYPRRVPKLADVIPKEVADDFLEAVKCEAVFAPKATVTQCRRALQNACSLQGAPSNVDLINQIDHLEAQRIINPTLKDIAHTIRMIGNWGAHPQKDLLRDVTPSDATEVLKFTGEFLDEIFVRHARLKELKTRKGIQ